MPAQPVGITVMECVQVLADGTWINPLNIELNPICHLLTLLEAHPIFHISRIRVNVAQYCWQTTPSFLVFSFGQYILSIKFYSSYTIYCSTIYIVQGRDSSVGIATRYRLDGPGIESRWRRDFPHPSRPALGPTQPSTQWVPVTSQRQSGRGVALNTHSN
jgi:hypothetical protein